MSAAINHAKLKCQGHKSCSKSLNGHAKILHKEDQHVYINYFVREQLISSQNQNPIEQSKNSGLSERTKISSIAATPESLSIESFLN